MLNKTSCAERKSSSESVTQLRRIQLESVFTFQVKASVTCISQSRLPHRDVLVFKWSVAALGGQKPETSSSTSFSDPIVMWVHFKLKTYELLTSEGELHLPVRSPRQVGDPPQTHTDGHDVAAVWRTGAPVHIVSPCSSLLLLPTCLFPSSSAGDTLLPSSKPCDVRCLRLLGQVLSHVWEGK